MDKIRRAKDALTGHSSGTQNAQVTQGSGKDARVEYAPGQRAKKGAPSKANPDINNVFNDEINKHYP
ncbi:hypothetical protein JX266_013127 [Neoarthrinium moseri]|nr:hypothetical protein JX266_013127 [Neoarthrinium moseri]